MPALPVQDKAPWRYKHPHNSAPFSQAVSLGSSQPLFGLRSVFLHRWRGSVSSGSVSLPCPLVALGAQPAFETDLITRISENGDF